MRLFIFIFIFMLISFGEHTVLGMDSDKLQTQKEMNEIAKKEFDKANNELNELYDLLIKYLNAESKKKLISAEKAWIKYRDAHCEAVTYNYQGGSAFYLIKYSCLREITEQRVNVLKSAYQEKLPKQ